MQACIYCRNSNSAEFKSVEHVIPRSFGAFSSETPTLDCVCDRCNEYFKRELDGILARNTLEGVTRYKHDLYSRESRCQKGLIITLPKTQEMGEFGGVEVWLDGVTGKIMPLLPQVHFKQLDTNEYVVVKKDELERFDWKAKGCSNKDIKIFASSKSEHQEIVKCLEKIGVEFKKKAELDIPFNEKTSEITVNIKGVINCRIKRAFVKILFNFSAYYIGRDEVMKREWDSARDYVREGKEALKVRISDKPFWGEETNNIRMQDDSYNLRVENKGNNVVGTIQFFNLFLCEFILVENYNIPKEKEVAKRFTPGTKPCSGVKKGNILVAQYDEYGRLIVK